MREAALLTGDRDLAQDIVHDCFERYTSKDRSDVQNPSAYLRRMVINEGTKRLRGRSRETLVGEVPELIAEDTSMLQFYDALSALTPRRRAALVLRYHADLPVTEIATILECSPTTVSSLIRRGLTDLRRA